MGKCTKACVPQVLIDADKMSARLKLCWDAMGVEYTLKELLGYLTSHGVKSGIREDMVREMIESDIYDVYKEVARGKEPVPGEDGHFVFHVKAVEETKTPKVLDDGSVEYVRTHTHTIVEEGALLAEYIPATNGQYGYTVGNEMRKPARGKELPRLKGRGFRVDGTKYYAAMHGKVEITEYGMQLSSLLEIKEDIDINYGHINFDGDVEIRGDVHSGMMVKASGNIDIRGHVGNCFIEAGKNITVQNGMQGKLSGKLKAGGNIYCKFFENAQAEAGGDIMAKSILNSKIEAKGKIKVEGKEALILGGSVWAVQGIEAMVIGNVMEVPTVVCVGCFTGSLTRRFELENLIKEKQEELEKIERGIRIAEFKLKEEDTPKNREKRQKITQAKVIKNMELNECKVELARLEELISGGKGAQVIVQRNIYPGCRVEIAGNRIEVKEQLKHVKFVLRDGNIEAALLY